MEMRKRVYYPFYFEKSHYYDSFIVFLGFVQITGF